MGEAAINVDFRRRLAESDVQKQCDALVRQCGGEVISFAQPRATMQTEGIPDRRYVVFGRAFWWEVKAADGQLTASQHDFLVRDLHADGLAGCGTVEDLRDYLTQVRISLGVGRAAGFALVARWAARGFRRERKRKRG